MNDNKEKIFTPEKEPKDINKVSFDVLKDVFKENKTSTVKNSHN